MIDPPQGLGLRLRQRRRDFGPPDVDAFAGARRTDRAQLIPRPAPVGVAAAPSARPRPDVVVVYFEHATFPIPSIEAGIESTAVAPDVAAFAIRATRLGYLAEVSRDRVRPGRVAWLVAACMPLALAPNLARAAPPKISPPSASAPEVQRPAKGREAASNEAPNEAPDKRRDKATNKTTNKASDPTGPAKASPDGGDETSPPTGPDDLGDLVVEPPPTRPPPAPPAVLMTCPEQSRNVSVIDAAWEGVLGYDVSLTLINGRELEGRVSAIQAKTFTLLDSQTGVVRVLRKSAVKHMRAEVAQPVPAQDGVGLLVGGGLLAAVGAPVFLAGAVFLGVCPSCAYLHLPMLFVGGGAVGGAIPMLVRGARRRKAYNEARNRRGMPAPVLSRTRHGWSGGLRLRF